MEVIYPIEWVDFLGCPVARLTTSQALGWMAAVVADRQPRRVVVVNANKLYLMSRDVRLRRIVESADLIIPEWAIVWGAQQLGLPPLYHSGGLLVAKALMPYAVSKGLRLYLLGARPDVINTLVRKLQADYSQLTIAGFHDGYLTTPEIESAVLTDIRRAQPDILLVAMGSPKQEIWIHEYQQRLCIPVSLGVGGSFDVLSGIKPDAPAWARGRGLEWLWRLAHNPRAYTSRYLITNTWFVWQVFRARTARR